MDHFPTVFAYLGPETMLPMTSVVAGIAGVLMMFGRRAWVWVSGTVRRLSSRRLPEPKVANGPRRIGAGPVLRSGTLERNREQVQS